MVKVFCSIFPAEFFHGIPAEFSHGIPAEFPSSVYFFSAETERKKLTEFRGIPETENSVETLYWMMLNQLLIQTFTYYFLF